MTNARVVLTCMVLLAGCASAPRAPQMTPDPLLGAWRGEFKSTTPGHSGILHLNVNTYTGGETLMIAEEWTQPGSRYFEAAPATVQQPELIGTTVERSGANEIRLVLHKYLDQRCNCDVTVVFTGLVNWNTMDGTFRGIADSGHVMFEGKWTAQRIILEPDSRLDSRNSFAD